MALKVYLLPTILTSQMGAGSSSSSFLPWYAMSNRGHNVEMLTNL